MADKTETFDGWSVAHVIVGASLRIFKVPRFAAYTIIILTEIVEVIFRRFGVTFFRETELNVASDLFFSIGAYELFRLR